MKKSQIAIVLILIIIIGLIVIGVKQLNLNKEILITGNDSGKDESETNISASLNETAKSQPTNKIPIYYKYSIPENAKGPFIENNNNLLIDAAIINARWFLTNPEEGKYDWTILDKKISDWVDHSNKKVFIQISPYGQTPRTDSPTGDNDITPQWIYEKGVPRITFAGGGEARGAQVSVPKAWDPNFYPIYEDFIKALADKYDNDPRIIGYQIGFGHLGTMNAQPSKDGSQTFQANGWTLAIWRDHIKKIIEISQKHLTKPLLIRTSTEFLRGYDFFTRAESTLF